MNALQKRQERKEREKEVRRQEILKTAIEMFGQQGFIKTTMEQIADEAALAVGTLYRYYTSKEELFVSIVFDAISIMHQQMEVIVNGSEPPQVRLKLIWTFFYKFYEQNPMYYRALLFLHDPSFTRAFTETAEEAVKRFSGKNFRVLTLLIKEGMADQVFRKGHPREMADFLWASFIGLVQLSESRKNLQTTPNDLKTLHKEMWRYIERGIFA